MTYEILGEHPERHVVIPGHPGVIEPEVPHRVTPIGQARFFIELLAEQ